VKSTGEIRNRTCLVTMAGEFDRANVDTLRAEIERCLESATSVVFDFQKVTFINGSVMALLHDVLERVGKDGWLAVARPSASIERLFSVAGLAALPNFRVFSSLEEALAVIDRD
jgi:anti-anti-sigma factor